MRLFGLHRCTFPDTISIEVSSSLSKLAISLTVDYQVPTRMYTAPAVRTTAQYEVVPVQKAAKASSGKTK